MLNQLRKFSEELLSKNNLYSRKSKEFPEISESINCTFTCRVSDAEKGEMMTNIR